MESGCVGGGGQGGRWAAGQPGNPPPPYPLPPHHTHTHTQSHTHTMQAFCCLATLPGRLIPFPPPHTHTQALCSLATLPERLRSFILSPQPSRAAQPRSFPSTDLPPALKAALQQRFNTEQLRGVAACLDSAHSQFALVQVRHCLLYCLLLYTILSGWFGPLVYIMQSVLYWLYWLYVVLMYYTVLVTCSTVVYVPL